MFFAVCNAFLVPIAESLWDFVIQPSALAVMAVGLASSWAIGRRVANHYRCPRVVAILFVVAVVVVVALTLTPGESRLNICAPRPPHFLQQLGDGHLIWAQLTGWPNDSEQLANIALYIPVGFLGTLVRQSAARAAGFGIALTVFIETCQYGIVGRDGSITDIRNNAAGAILGALFGVIAARFRRDRTRPH